MTKSDAEKWADGLAQESKLGPEFLHYLLIVGIPAVLWLIYQNGGEVIGPDAKEC